MADVPILMELMRRVSTAAIGEADASEDEVHDELVGPRFDISRDTALVLDVEGRAVVYARACDEHDDRAYIDVFVDPALSDNVFADVANRALAGAKARLQEALTLRGASRTTVAAGLYRGEHRMLAAYEAAGLKRERVYRRMSFDLLGTKIPEVAIVEGVSIQTVDPDDDEVMSVAFALRNDTFSDHHGHVDSTFADYAEVWRTATSYDRQAWWFAYLDGAAVGLCLGDEAKSQDRAGYIRTLGVTNDARGRGIGRALLLTSFTEYLRRGRTSVRLGVDSSNETAAGRLYEGVGMKPILAIDSLAMQISVSSAD